jgi:ketosteroid isomerase-like protein
MRRNKIVGLLLIVACVIFFTLVSGCTHPRPDPETGVKEWIAAVNDRDFVRAYDLAPMEIRRQITKDEFIREQDTNPLLAPGNSLESYTITNRTVSGDTASLTAQIVLITQDAGSSSRKKIALYLKFVEQYENGEWKVWTTAP